MLYANGLGVPQDKTQAAGLFLSAAKQGYAPAYALIAGAYITGDGVPFDYPEASFWFAFATVTESQSPLAKADAMQLGLQGCTCRKLIYRAWQSERGSGLRITPPSRNKYKENPGKVAAGFMLSHGVDLRAANDPSCNGVAAESANWRGAEAV